MIQLCRVEGPDNAVEIGPGRPLAVIAGPCVLEEPDLTLTIARTLRDACRDAGISYIFKASFDKANRTSAGSARGPGIDAGISLLARVRRELAVPVTTDVHEPAQAELVAEVADLLQIPAFLCRQTDLLTAVGKAAAGRNRAVNVKKGQFLSPSELAGPIGKLTAVGARNLLITERGTFFGYHRLVNDLIGMGDLIDAAYSDGKGGALRVPLCFDCTHSAQLPGLGATTGGRRDRVPLLARAGVAAGAHAVFMECHPEPEKARSDASTMLPLSQAPALLRRLQAIHKAVC